MNSFDRLKRTTAPPRLAQPGAREVIERRLLILQSTPFCNINCSYCYLPNRDVRATMSIDTVKAAVRAMQADGLNNGQLTALWHAGEPLALPASYYREVFAAIRDEQFPDAPVALRIQTNATPVTEDHCQLFREYGVKVGVSLDGPEFLHDANRRTRNGRGTYSLTLRGLERLQHYGLVSGVICVVTKSTLKHGRELVHFFHSLGVTRLALNFEEIDGINTGSSLKDEELDNLEAFLRDVRQASRETGVRVREFEELELLLSGDFLPDQEVTPFSIVAVDWRGNFTTFSPELLDLEHEKYGHLCFGNVHDGSILSAARHPKFKAVHAEIREGVERCRAECSFFDICGGGAPSNKLAERGTFAATETLYCRLRKKTVAKVYFEGVVLAQTTAANLSAHKNRAKSLKGGRIMAVKKSAKKRTEVKDLPRKEKKLSAEEAKRVKGGSTGGNHEFGWKVERGTEISQDKQLTDKLR